MHNLFSGRALCAPGLVIALTLLFQASVARAQTIITTPPKNLQIVVWSGNSNAIGPLKLAPGNNELAGAHTYTLTLGGKWTRPAFEPSHTTEAAYGGSLYPSIFPANVRTGAGAVLPFLKKWTALNPDRNVALLNVAVSGSQLTGHLPPGPAYQAAKSQITKAKGYGQVVGFIWLLGEPDTSYLDRAKAWAENFVKLVTAVRADHGANIPVVIAQLGDPVDPARFIYWQLVREQQEKTCTLITKCAVVSTAGLKKLVAGGVEGVHYKADSYQTMGEALALALYALRH